MTDKPNSADYSPEDRETIRRDFEREVYKRADREDSSAGDSGVLGSRRGLDPAGGDTQDKRPDDTNPRTAGPDTQTWCEHVGGLGPPFPFCKICAAGPDTPRTDALFTAHIEQNKARLPDVVDAIRQVKELFEHARQLERELAAKDRRIAELERNHLGEGTFTCTCHSYPHAPNCGLDERLIVLTEQLTDERKQHVLIRNKLANQLAEANARAREAAVFVASTEQEIDDLESQIATLTTQLAKAKSLYANERDNHRAAQMFERTKAAIDSARDCILNGRGALEAVLDGDQTNAVLAEFDQIYDALQPEPEQGGEKEK